MSVAETEPAVFNTTRLEPETRVGHYELIDHLATTGMSVVYAARSLVNEEAVALKLPFNPEGAQKLREEISIHTQFSDHPSIVTIDGCGVWHEQPFLATRLQEGGTLNDDIEAGQTSSSGWISGVLAELEAKILQDDRDCGTDLEEVYNAVNALYKEGLVNIITTNTSAIDAEEVVGAVTDAAKELGHDMLPGSPVAAATAKLLLEKEAARATTAEAPDYDTVISRTAVLRGIALGVEVLNRAGVVHADVKAQNAAINRKGEGRLIDFGIAVPTRPHAESYVCGSIGNIPQEGYLGYLTAQNDAFALAVTGYRAYTGQAPFTIVPGNAEATFRHLTEDTVTPICDLNNNVPPGLGNVIMWGLAPDPVDRASTTHLRQAFELHC